MNSSRRTFLSRAALAAAALSLKPWQVFPGAAIAGIIQESRRGLLFDPGDLSRIQQTIEHPRFKPFWDSLVNADLEADIRFLTVDLRLNNHVADLLRARQILERTSFVYAITKDNRQRDVARTAIGRIMEYRRWDYFLEAGKDTIGLQRAPETTIAMCCALDWLGDAIDPATRSEMEKQIAEKGAPACYRTLYGMKYPDRVRGWGFDPESDYAFRFDLSRWPLILNATNLKVIPIAGLGLAGCTLHGRHPQARQWVELALQSARAFSSMFGSDGAYEEGVAYWGYTAQHLTVFLDALYRTLGIDERSIINFPGTVRYGLQMSMPTHGKADDCINFGDAWSMGDVSVAAWTAREKRDGVAQYVATTTGEIKSHCALVWFDPSIPAQAPGEELLDVRFTNDWVVSRTGWDEQSTVVALRSGGPSNHEHADRNSIIFKAYGERLFHDPFKAAYSHTQAHWLLRQTEAHTAVLIDGKGHQYHDGSEGTNASWAVARVVRYVAAQDHMIVTSDATEAYRLINERIEAVIRTLLFIKPDILLIHDRIRLSSAPLGVQVRFQVYGDDHAGSVEATGNGFHITRPLADLRAIATGSGRLGFRTDRLAVPEENGIHPFVELDSPTALDHEIVTVCTAQRHGSSHGSMTVRRKGSKWQITGSHNGRSVDVTLQTAEDVPAVTLG